jgi:putative glutamine amidotransferase
MKRILISQRRDPVAGRDETRDSLDVRLPAILFNLGFLPVPLCSDIKQHEDYIRQLEPDGVFISGGNNLGEHPHRDSLEHALLTYAEKEKLPVMGLCRGTQMINHYLGGGLESVQGHVASRHQLLGLWAENKGYGEVNSYHDFAITEKTLAAQLRALAWTADGVIEAVAHKSLPWLGIMWHPEREPSVAPQDAVLIQQHFKGRHEA